MFDRFERVGYVKEQAHEVSCSVNGNSFFADTHNESFIRNELDPYAFIQQKYFFWFLTQILGARVIYQ